MRLRHNIPSTIIGGVHKDHRGEIKFVNDFNMSEVKRMYITAPSNDTVLRAWQGHKKEQKWFYCIKGKFEIFTLKPNNWSNPSRELEVLKFELEESTSKVLHVPEGYVNGFRSLESGSSVIVYSDFTVEESNEDDFRYDQTYWKV